MRTRPSRMWTGIALAATVPMFLLAAPASAQDSRHSGGAGPAGNSGGAATAGPSGSGTVSVGSSGSSGGGGGSSASFGGNTGSGSSVSGSGSGPSGVRGPITARDSATGGGGVVVGRAVHGADTSAYRSGDGAGGRFSDHTAGRVIGLEPAARTSDAGSVPAYSRPRDGAAVSGSAVPRGSVPMQPGPGGGISYVNNGNAYGYYGVGGYYGLGYASCDPYGFTSSLMLYSAYSACNRPYGYGANVMGYDPWYASTMMGAFSADPWYGGSGGGSSTETWTPDSPEDATLRLKIKPSQAEVFVDGFFVGVVNDFDGMFQKLHIESGAHRIEVRAPGYETLDLDIKLTAGKTTVYQGELTKIK
jgi:PEGA domain